METDKRYAATTDVPDSLKSPLGGSTKGEYSIRGDFREGRAAYLDMSSTTPLDPRVFDKMAPYMVRDSESDVHIFPQSILPVTA